MKIGENQWVCSCIVGSIIKQLATQQFKQLSDTKNGSKSDQFHHQNPPKSLKIDENNHTQMIDSPVIIKFDISLSSIIESWTVVGQDSHITIINHHTEHSWLELKSCSLYVGFGSKSWIAFRKKRKKNKNPWGEIIMSN